MIFVKNFNSVKRPFAKKKKIDDPFLSPMENENSDAIITECANNKS